MTNPTLTVTEKNKKSEILEAYADLLEKVSNAKTSDLPIQDEKKTKEQEVLSKTKTYSATSIRGDVAQFKKNLITKLDELVQDFVKQLDATSGKLEEELQRLEEIRQAIAIEEKKLKELYGIKDASISLSQFLQTLEEEKKHWEMKKQEQEKASKESLQQRGIQRQREEEEYDYHLKQQRKQEEDKYKREQAQIREKFETMMRDQRQEVDQKEDSLQKQLEELEALRSFKTQSEQWREKGIQEALSQQKNSLEKDFKVQFEIQDQKNTATVQLLERDIEHLKSLIAGKGQEVIVLKKEAEEAQKKAQELAVKVIDSRKREVKFVEGGEKSGHEGMRR